MEGLLGLVELTAGEFIFASSAVFLAGLVRGFAGFALSALVMASVVLILPPVELIAVCWFLELGASVLMVRSGMKDADFGVVKGLLLGAVIGTPVGLYLTTSLPIDQSKLIALIIILVLAALQLLKVRASFLATTPGLYISGVTSGLANGLAGVGGMVVALYVLAREASAKSMRGSLVMYLFASNLISSVFLIYFGMLNSLSVVRGVIWIIPCLVGVILGQMLFRPSLEGYYKPFCLLLLIALAITGMMRIGLTV